MATVGRLTSGIVVATVGRLTTGRRDATSFADIRLIYRYLTHLPIFVSGQDSSSREKSSSTSREKSSSSSREK